MNIQSIGVTVAIGTSKTFGHINANAMKQKKASIKAPLCHIPKTNIESIDYQSKNKTLLQFITISMRQQFCITTY